jgi:hypothetical protein
MADGLAYTDFHAWDEIGSCTFTTDDHLFLRQNIPARKWILILPVIVPVEMALT